MVGRKDLALFGTAALLCLIFLMAMDNIARGITAAPEERNQSMEAYNDGSLLLPAGD